jgi:hypothetical protein
MFVQNAEKQDSFSNLLCSRSRTLIINNPFRPTTFDVASPAHISFKVCWLDVEMKITAEETDGIYYLRIIRSFNAAD